MHFVISVVSRYVFVISVVSKPYLLSPVSHARIAIGVFLIAIGRHCCVLGNHNYWKLILVGTSSRLRTIIAAGAPSPPSGKCTKGKPKNEGGHPSTKVNSPKGEPKQKSSSDNAQVKSSLMKSLSPSTPTTPSTEGTKHPSLSWQQEECKDREKLSRRIKNAVLHLRLRQRIEKI